MLIKIGIPYSEHFFTNSFLYFQLGEYKVSTHLQLTFRGLTHNQNPMEAKTGEEKK